MPRDGRVDSADAGILIASLGSTGGHADYESDFDYDGDVDGNDLLIWQQNTGLTKCASRAEGDANGDGAVNSADLSIWQSQFGSSGSSSSCGGSSAATSGGGGELSLLASSEFSTDSDLDETTLAQIDTNKDGDFDRQDVTLWLELQGQ